MMRIRGSWVAGAAAAATLLVGTTGLAQARPGAGVANITTGCSLTMSCGGTQSWPSANGPVTGGRYVNDSQINTTNVSRLKLAWTFHSGIPGGTEDYPVVVDGVAYVTTEFGNVYALNAATGQQIWVYKPPAAIAQLDHGAPNRGVAVGNNSVYVLDNADQLLRLNAATGALVWAKSVIANGPRLGYTESVAPVYYNGILYVGSAGGDSGVRGFEEAMSARTGALIWRFWTVPKAHTGWLRSPGNHGGGATWGIPTLDPAANRIYFGTGNPSPDFYAGDRPGLNPYTDSVVALTMNTGKFVWAYDETPHDMWDYDAVASPVLFPAQGMMAVGDGGKNGYWYEWDAKNGTLITMPLTVVKQDHGTPPINAPAVPEWPGSGAGFEWTPGAYDPQTGMVYNEAINTANLEKAVPNVAAQHKVGQLDVATAFMPLPKGQKTTGSIVAISADNGTVSWQQKTVDGVVGGATATAGGLVFAAQSGTGVLEAFDARTGKVLWTYQSHQAVAAGPSIYTMGGHEYVLFPLGGSLYLSGPTDLQGYAASDATFMAFELP